jgi:rhodanese-related sulfurtransferase
MTVLDARSGKYDDGIRIPGAKSLAPSATEAQVAALLPDKQALVVTYCANLHCPASKMLGERLRQLGYTHVLEYHEGIEGWKAAGNATEKAAQ